MSKKMPKDVAEAYLRRMPILKALPTDERTSILEVLDKYHRVMEKETYQLVLGMVHVFLRNKDALHPSESA